MTAVDLLRPGMRRYVIAYDAACVFAASLFVGLSAQIAIPLPFSPVPVTGQTLAALLAGALLGSRLGPLSLLLYLAQGAFGLPVFAGGAFGLARLAGPTGGYLMGLVAAAFVTGLLAERGWDRRPWTVLPAMLIGNLVIYACGVPWLARFVGAEHALVAGFWPFIPGDLLKLALAATLLPAGWRLFLRGGHRKEG